MADYGHTQTDKMLKKLEGTIDYEYGQSVKTIKKKLNAYLKQFKEQDKQKKALVKQGLLSKSDYDSWKLKKMATGERWNQLMDVLVEDQTNKLIIARKMIGEHLKDVYALNHNYGAYEIEHGAQVNLSFTLYDHATVERLLRDNPQTLPQPGKKVAQDIAAGKAKRWSKRQLQGIATQAILTGSSIPDIANKIAKNFGVSQKYQAIRAARTMTTTAENAGRMDSYKHAEALGISLKKTWMAALDSRTRHAHRLLDGKMVEVDKPFEVEGQKIMYPGDLTAPAYLVYNCRCTLIANVKGTSLEGGIAGFERNSKLGDMSYEEWKEETVRRVHKEGQEDKRSQTRYSTFDLASPQRPRKSDFDDEDEYMRAREKYREERHQYEERLNQIIDDALDYKRFENQEDVRKWAESRGIKIEDEVFENIDLRAFNEASVALDEMFNRFPEVFNSEYEDFDGNKFKSNFWIGLTQDGLLSANGGFNFNPSYFRDYKEGLDSAFRGQAEGYLVRGDGTFSSLVRHEYGHNVQSYIEEKIAQKYHAHVDDWRKNFGTFGEYQEAKKQYQEERRRYEDELRALAGLKGSSEYSNTNNLELFAEGFAEYTSGAQSEFGKKFGEFLARWY